MQLHYKLLIKYSNYNEATQQQNSTGKYKLLMEKLTLPKKSCATIMLLKKVAKQGTLLVVLTAFPRLPICLNFFFPESLHMSIKRKKIDTRHLIVNIKKIKGN